MSSRTWKTLVLGGCVAMAGCATYGGYRPTVDTANDPNARHLTRDEIECRELAKQASGGAGKEAVKGGAVGGLLGAAAGAAIGAVTGSPGAGAAIGAAGGGLGGGAYKGLGADEAYQHAFQDCMRGRGHPVIN